MADCSVDIIDNPDDVLEMEVEMTIMEGENVFEE